MVLLYCVFFFKQKTAYEMRISDWSSDGALPIFVFADRAGCRLEAWIRRERAARPLPDLAVHLLQSADVACRLRPQAAGLDEIAADREAVCGVFPFRFARQTLAGPARIRIGDRKSTRLNSSH